MKRASFIINFLTIIFIFFTQVLISAQESLETKNEETTGFTVEDTSSKISSDGSAKEGEKNFELHNIVVTGQKRKQKIQDVAGSISAMNSRQVEDAGIKGTEDIYPYVPNLTAFGLEGAGMGFSYYGIRGQTNFNSYSNSVGIYIDGVPRLLSGNVTNSSLWDVEQIEVLRGPQGNLYGLSSSGGIINITTKKPDNYWTGNASASYGNYNAQKYQASLSGPVISDQLFFNFSGTYKRLDSYVEEEGKDDRVAKFGAGRAQIKWTPSQNLDIVFSAESGTEDRNYTWFTLQDDDPFKIPSHNYDEYDDSGYHIQSLQIKYSTSLFDIVSVTGNTILKQEGDMEMFTGGAMYRHYDMPTSKMMEELRLVSNKERSPLKWMVGGFFQKGTEKYKMLTMYSGMEMTNQDSEVQRKTYALFGQASYTFIEKLTLTAGIRYDREKQKYVEDTSGLDFSTMDPYEYEIEKSENWDAVSPRMSVDYRISKIVMLYTSAAKGYKAGGFTGGDTADQKYDQEEVWSYELGTKTNWLNNRLIFNLCGFYTKADNLQTFYYDSSYNFVYENTAKAVMYGFETEVSARPVNWLEVSMPVGYVSTEIKEHEIESNEGNKVPMSPEYTVGLTAQYTHKSGLYVRGEWNMLGKTFYNEENTVSQGAYSLFNARLGYKREHFTVSAFFKNILDKQYYTYIYENSPYNFASVGAPRTFGAEASIMF
ncbi:MAG: TonB-dependent receptor [Spirochaetes bacterium]|nr:TonB-dependent receptor [Spirochaetota bacterium]